MYTSMSNYVHGDKSFDSDSVKKNLPRKLYICSMNPFSQRLSQPDVAIAANLQN